MSSDLNGLPLQQMNDVDWDKLTEQQAAGFGLSLSLFNDAVEQHRLARAVFYARAASLVVATIVGVTLLSWTNPVAAVIGMLGSLTLGLVGSGWYALKTNKLVTEAAEALKADVAQLPQG